MVRIDFCRSNVDLFTSELYEQLRAMEPEVRVSRYGCLANCGECSEKPYAFVDDEIISAETVAELKEKIFSVVKQRSGEKARK